MHDPGRDVVILSDADGPGRSGALQLAAALYRPARTLRIAEPIDDCKDARDWAQSASAAEIACTLDNAERWRP